MNSTTHFILKNKEECYTEFNNAKAATMCQNVTKFILKWLNED